MSVYKEIEITTSDFKASDLIEDLEERIEAKALPGFHTEAHIEKMKPKIQEMLAKLKEIEQFLV